MGQKKWVIDGDELVKIESFDSDNTENVISYYLSLGKYEDVSVDINGDIICFQDISDDN